MAKCDYCGSLILFGGARDGNLRFCNEKCQSGGTLLKLSGQIPEDVVQKQLWEVHQGACPECHGRGPVDVHTAHQIWSALVLTSWKSVPQVSCRACGVKQQLMSLVLCLVAGWWGFPWGLIMTPVQVVRNLAGLVKGPDPMTPSPQLEKMVRLHVAQRAMALQAQS